MVMMTPGDKWIDEQLKDLEVKMSFCVDGVTELLDVHPTLRVGRKDLVNALANVAKAQLLIQDARNKRLLSE